jgi:hypothetical protein
VTAVLRNVDPVSLAPVPSSAGSLDIENVAANGSFAFHLGGVKWLSSGGAYLAAQGTTFSSNDGTLKPTKFTPGVAGFDPVLGPYMVAPPRHSGNRVALAITLHIAAVVVHSIGWSLPKAAQTIVSTSSGVGPQKSGIFCLVRTSVGAIPPPRTPTVTTGSLHMANMSEQSNGQGGFGCGMC